MRIRALKTFSTGEFSLGAGSYFTLPYSEALPLIANGMVESAEYVYVSNPIALSVANIDNTYGVHASVGDKAKALHKFGHNAATAADTWETVQATGGTEELLTSNAITVLDSTSASDTGDVHIEGHYLAGDGTLVFHVQTVTLAGTSAVTLPQALARCSRMSAHNFTPVGNITVNAGEAGTEYNRITAGNIQSEKCATSISYRDYYIITAFGSSILGNNNAAVEFALEFRHADDSSWVPVAKWALKGDFTSYERKAEPPFVVPANGELRIRSKSSKVNTSVDGYFDGHLAVNEDFVSDASPAPA